MSSTLDSLRMIFHPFECNKPHALLWTRRKDTHFLFLLLQKDVTLADCCGYRRTETLHTQLWVRWPGNVVSSFYWLFYTKQVSHNYNTVINETVCHWLSSMVLHIIGYHQWYCTSLVIINETVCHWLSSMVPYIIDYHQWHCTSLVIINGTAHHWLSSMVLHIIGYHQW